MNINNSIEDNKIFPELRKKLLKLNPDLLFGVYIIEDSDKYNLSFSLIENTLATYKNQFSNLNITEEYKNINIIDLVELRKGNISYLKKGNGNIDNKNLVLLSNGIIEYFVGRTGKKHIITNLRDGKATDKQQRTTTAGRNEGKNLIEEMEQELYSESPFLVVDEKGNYALAIANGNEKGWYYTKKSLKIWLSKKYNLSRNKKEDLIYIKMFERSFPGIKYEELGNILKNIIKNNRYITYNWRDGDIEGIEKFKRNISLGDSKLKAYVFHDKNNNTYEYRTFREITGITKKGYKSIGNRFGRLYLESSNQGSKLHRIENANNEGGKENFVFTTDFISKQTKQILSIKNRE